MQLSPSESFCADTQLIFLCFFLGCGPHSSMVYKSILPPTGSELCGPGGQDFPWRSYGLPRPSALSVQTPVVDMAGLGPGAQLASPGGCPSAYHRGPRTTHTTGGKCRVAFCLWELDNGNDLDEGGKRFL